jgi:hypothetical protein
MPPHTRSQRRRQPNRTQPRPMAGAEVIEGAPSTGTTVNVETPASAPVLPAPRSARTGNRRVLTRPAPEPIDYTKDYAAARLDLRRIVLWAILLFVAMFALKFSGLV